MPACMGERLPMIDSIKESPKVQSALVIVTTMGVVASVLFLCSTIYHAQSDSSFIIFIPVFAILAVVYAWLLKRATEQLLNNND